MLNILKEQESDIVNLLAGSPLMPPTLLVRPFEESFNQTGRVASNDNIQVRFLSIESETLSETDEQVAVNWVISWEIMLSLRDLRGHHAAYQLIETVLFLLTNYRLLYSNRPLTPRNVEFTELDENNFRYWSMKFDNKIKCFDTWYLDPREAVPVDVRCLQAECDQLWTGFDSRGGYNVCWRRYQKPGEDKFRFYNFCSQREGDEIDNIFNDEYHGPDGPIVPETFNVNLGIFRNEAGKIPRKENKVAQITVKSGQNIINNSTLSCSFCGS